jgi:hypothetical protein
MNLKWKENDLLFVIFIWLSSRLLILIGMQLIASLLHFSPINFNEPGLDTLQIKVVVRTLRSPCNQNGGDETVISLVPEIMVRSHKYGSELTQSWLRSISIGNAYFILRKGNIRIDKLNYLRTL